MSTIDPKALKDFDGVLEAFISNITSACSNMETGITSCNRYMNDETSQRILAKSKEVINQIRTVLNPAQNVLELIKEEQRHLSKGPGTNI